MRFYGKLVRVGGETVLAVEQANGKVVAIWPLTKKIVAKNWK